MTDRELLELAARAAGIEGEWGDSFDIGFSNVDCSDLFFLKDDSNCAIWNPLDDDGDALRLAVKLKIDLVHTNIHGALIHAYSDSVEDVSEDISKEPFAATRRAIVRAAAEIGRSI